MKVHVVFRSYFDDEDASHEEPEEAFLDFDQAVEYSELRQDQEEWPRTEYYIKTLKLGDKEFSRASRKSADKLRSYGYKRED